ncbi:hypothetical protein [Candidatus Uabimicrobium sp. HlEnr_7]|uniref:hypothetical protein n=1 Tax=Candidatus Uabimicrobium helgolandensis TaxID=3095367 RepID=UPI0035568D22
MKKVLIRTIMVIFTLVSICAVGFFGLKYFPWSAASYRKQHCLKSLERLNYDLTIYSVSNSTGNSISAKDFGKSLFFHNLQEKISNHTYPANFNSLFATNILKNDDCTIHNCFSCPSTNGLLFQKYNIFGEKIGNPYLNIQPKIDYCYLYHKSLPAKKSTILVYCPNQHGNSIATIFYGGNVDYVSVNDFRRQFNLQTKLLTKAQVKFSFNKGIISGNEAREQ